jgi:hypothetical protein
MIARESAGDWRRLAHGGPWGAERHAASLGRRVRPCQESPPSVFPVATMRISAADEEGTRWDLILKDLTGARRRLMPRWTVRVPDSALTRRRKMTRRDVGSCRIMTRGRFGIDGATGDDGRKRHSGGSAQDGPFSTGAHRPSSRLARLPLEHHTAAINSA